jgi:hypothetical protein
MATKKEKPGWSSSLRSGFNLVEEQEETTPEQESTLEPELEGSVSKSDEQEGGKEQTVIVNETTIVPASAPVPVIAPAPTIQPAKTTPSNLRKRISLYLDPAQVKKLDRLIVEHHTLTGQWVNQNELIRYLIDACQVEQVLKGFVANTDATSQGD